MACRARRGTSVPGAAAVTDDILGSAARGAERVSPVLLRRLSICPAGRVVEQYRLASFSARGLWRLSLRRLCRPLPFGFLEPFQAEPLCTSPHTACRPPEKARLSRSVLTGRCCAAASRSAFFNGKTRYPVKRFGKVDGGHGGKAENPFAKGVPPSPRLWRLSLAVHARRYPAVSVLRVCGRAVMAHEWLDIFAGVGLSSPHDDNSFMGGGRCAGSGAGHA